MLFPGQGPNAGAPRSVAATLLPGAGVDLAVHAPVAHGPRLLGARPAPVRPTRALYLLLLIEPTRYIRMLEV